MTGRPVIQDWLLTNADQTQLVHQFDSSGRSNRTRSHRSNFIRMSYFCLIFATELVTPMLLLTMWLYSESLQGNVLMHPRQITWWWRYYTASEYSCIMSSQELRGQGLRRNYDPSWKACIALNVTSRQPQTHRVKLAQGVCLLQR